MNTHDEAYTRLARVLDTLPNGFPPSADGVEFDLLRKIFTPREAELFCDMRLTFETAEQVAAVVAAVAPKPVNLLVNTPFITVAEAAALGVRRISVGGTLARLAWLEVRKAAQEIADSGTFSRFADLPNPDALFGQH